MICDPFLSGFLHLTAFILKSTRILCDHVSALHPPSGLSAIPADGGPWSVCLAAAGGAVKVLERVPAEVLVFISLGFIPRSGIAESYGDSMFIFLRERHTGFHHFASPPTVCEGARFFYIPANNCYFPLKKLQPFWWMWSWCHSKESFWASDRWNVSQNSTQLPSWGKARRSWRESESEPGPLGLNCHSCPQFKPCVAETERTFLSQCDDLRMHVSVVRTWDCSLGCPAHAGISCVCL